MRILLDLRYQQNFKDFVVSALASIRTGECIELEIPSPESRHGNAL